MKNLSPIFIIFIALFTSCTQIICGAPLSEEKEFMDSLNMVYQNEFIGNTTPCYPGYYELHLKTDLDSTRLLYLDSLLKTKGYIELLVYDVDGELIWGDTGSM